MNDKLSLEDVEAWEGAAYHGPIVFSNKKGEEVEVSALDIAEQLANVMRENERFLDALKQTTEVLECLQRGHGAVVSGMCFPALNTAREVLDEQRNKDLDNG